MQSSLNSGRGGALEDAASDTSDVFDLNKPLARPTIPEHLLPPEELAVDLHEQEGWLVLTAVCPPVAPFNRASISLSLSLSPSLPLSLPPSLCRARRFLLTPLDGACQSSVLGPVK